LEYTNFVEVNVPLFDKKALVNTIKWLDPTLIGWGIDVLYIWANGITEKRKYAIIHSIYCINPHVRKTNGKRELLMIKDVGRQRYIWETYALKIGCPHCLILFLMKLYTQMIELQ
jgi:hypothetical protein